MRALIASGTGRYADPWHPFDRTSARIAEVLTGAGFEVTVEPDVDLALQSLAGVDLLVVNAGDPWRDDPTGGLPPRDSIDGLARALERGIGVLAMHAAVSSLRDHPEWAATIGAIWVPGASMHPPIGETEVTGIRLPDAGTVEGFVVFDERYCRLQRIGRSTVVAEHDGPAMREPTAWVRTIGAARIAVDVLGHDERSYESAGHRRLVAQLARWAARLTE